MFLPPLAAFFLLDLIIKTTKAITAPTNRMAATTPPTAPPTTPPLPLELVLLSGELANGPAVLAVSDGPAVLAVSDDPAVLAVSDGPAVFTISAGPAVLAVSDGPALDARDYLACSLA